jgi:hypothetical protein
MRGEHTRSGGYKKAIMVRNVGVTIQEGRKWTVGE